jgi:hypothetical protein
MKSLEAAGFGGDFVSAGHQIVEPVRSSRARGYIPSVICIHVAEMDFGARHNASAGVSDDTPDGG